MDALLIRRPWIDKILGGLKTWELRGHRTHKRGLIALVQSGSGMVIGIARLTAVVGPLTLPQFINDASKAGFHSYSSGAPGMIGNTSAAQPRDRQPMDP
jgi:hypothetical protein